MRDCGYAFCGSSFHGDSLLFSGEKLYKTFILLLGMT